MGGLPDIKISSDGEILNTNDSEIQRFVWVIPVDNRNVPQFALQAYGESYFMVFQHTGTYAAHNWEGIPGSSG